MKTDLLWRDVLVAATTLVWLTGTNLSHSQPLNLTINFQTTNWPTPPGCLADTGAVFGDRGSGFRYGWNVDTSTNAFGVDSGDALDSRYASGIRVERPGQAFWEIALTNGVYSVFVVLGEPGHTDGIYALDIEGTPARTSSTTGAPEGTNYWVSGAAVVEVKDGRLTLSPGVGSFNDRLCFVEIRTATLYFSDSVITNQQFQLTVQLDPGSMWHSEASSNLLTWGTSSFGGGGTLFGGLQSVTINQAVTTYPCRFFRAQLLLPQTNCVVYSNSFSSPLGFEWTAHPPFRPSPIGTTPVGGRRFLGPFGPQTVDLSLSGLPSHRRLSIAFELFIMGDAITNLCHVQLSPSGWFPVLDATFNHGSQVQSYPASVEKGTFPAGTGAAEKDSLGYGVGRDTVYRLGYSFFHMGSTARFSFMGGVNPGGTNAAWGLANVAVTTQDYR